MQAAATASPTPMQGRPPLLLLLLLLLPPPSIPPSSPLLIMGVGWLAPGVCAEKGQWDVNGLGWGPEVRPRAARQFWARV